MEMEKRDTYKTACGASYEAKDNAGGNSCSGCAHDSAGLEEEYDCHHAPSCSAPFRADGRNVIWVKVV